MGDITEAFKKQYSDNLEMLATAPGFQPDGLFTVQRFDGEEFWGDQMGGVSLKEKGARSEELPIVDPGFRKRRIVMGTHHARTFIDEDDKLQMLLDPTSSYLTAYGDACKVTKWQIAIAAAIGPVVQGKNTPTTVELPATQKIDVGGAGFSFAKLKQAKLMLQTRGGLRPGEKPIVLWSSSQEADLMEDTKVSSSEYNNQKVLVDGELKYFYGCQFEKLDDSRDLVDESVTRLLPKSGTTRSIIMYAKSAVTLGLPKSGRNTVGRIDWNVDRQCNQASAAQRCGGTRFNDYGVAVIDCTESADI